MHEELLAAIDGVAYELKRINESLQIIASNVEREEIKPNIKFSDADIKYISDKTMERIANGLKEAHEDIRTAF